MRSAASFVIASVVALSLAAPSAAPEAQGRGNGRGQAAKPDKGRPDKGGKPDKAEKKPHPQEKGQKPPKKSDRDADVVVVDRDGHSRVIREHRGTGSLPPGLAKRESLPPGLRRQLVERGALPPGLRRYLVDVPGPWQTRLPAIPSHYHRYFAGDDLIVVDTRTNRIVAIVRDVLR
jgi:hypothetical protein